MDDDDSNIAFDDAAETSNAFLSPHSNSNSNSNANNFLPKLTLKSTMTPILDRRNKNPPSSPTSFK